MSIVGYKKLRMILNGRYKFSGLKAESPNKRRARKGNGIWWLIERGFRVNYVKKSAVSW